MTGPGQVERGDEPADPAADHQHRDVLGRDGRGHRAAVGHG